MEKDERDPNGLHTCMLNNDCLHHEPELKELKDIQKGKSILRHRDLQ